MASTNKTTNYNLSQFVGTDKPAWLTDYNGDMSKIDAQMKLNADGISTATGASATNTTNIGTLANLTTSTKTDLVSAINEVDNNADIAQGTANDAALDATSALGKATTLENAFNLTDFRTPTVSVTSGNTLTVSYSTVRSAVNADGTIGKIYGKFDITGTGTGNHTITIANTGFQPQSEFNVTGHAYAIQNQTSGGTTVYARYFTDLTMVYKTNGDVTISVDSFNGLSGRIMILPDIIFAKDFGD